MNFLTKLEDLVNSLIIRFCELMVRLFYKLTPPKVLGWLAKLKEGALYVAHNFKSIPALLKVFALARFAKTKDNLLAINYKEEALSSWKIVQNYYKEQSAKGVGKFKALITAPIMLISSWFQGLSVSQTLLLLFFTGASFLASVKMLSTSHRVIADHSEAGRTPASDDDSLNYERPQYYKKESRHVLVSNIRLPVYIGGVNDLRSVDIDFNATVSNRQSKKFLEKFEFQLRDYLILHIEPLVANFPLEEEGREIIKTKIWLEIDNFLKERQVEGHVTELKITYILAN